MVQCADCGYLAVRNKETMELIGAGKEQRDVQVLMFSEGKNLPPPVHAIPICSAGVCDLWTYAPGTPASCLAGVILRERDCKAFVDWIPALSPKEHCDMINAQADRLWQERQTERDRQWRKEDNRHMAWWGVAGIVLGVVLTTLAQIVTSKLSPSPSPQPPPVIQQSTQTAPSSTDKKSTDSLPVNKTPTPPPSGAH